jgi:hypothetical protein
MSKRSRVVSYGSVVLLVLAGIGAAVAFGGTFGQVLALALIGLGLVLATGLVFYEVGLSEDRERAQEAARRRPPRRDRPMRRRLDRMRGRRRRLR